MFEIRCIVGDKKLAEALRALGGLTLEPPVTLAVGEIQPLAEKKLKIRPVPGKTAFQIVTELIKKDRLKKITATQLRQYLVKHGYSSNGYSYALKLLLDKKVVRKTSEPSTYEVL